MFILSLISSCSQLIQYIDLFETTCIDIFGVQSPVIQWAEWMVSVPLMFYLTITLDGKKKEFNLSDYLILVCSFFGIAFLFLLNFNFSETVSLFMICLAVLSMGSALTLNFYMTWSEMKTSFDDNLKSARVDPYEIMCLSILKRKYIASLYLVCMFPVFPLVYFAGIQGFLNKEDSIAITLALNFISKTLYSILVSEAHSEILDSKVFQLIAEKRANDARRAFLRYVFHEVRVPLNSISMGLQLLQGNVNIDAEDRSTIMMMNEATSFMSDTLNDVLSIQKIEEGKLELQYEVFAVKSMINTVHLSLKGQLTSKNLNLIYSIDDNIPLKLRGDRFRIEHILANLISNAIKFSSSNSTITIKVKLQPGKDIPQENILIYFSVIDQGEGITVDTQKKLFIPYSQIKPRELQQGGGTGIGLAICKEIISLHGGEIGVHSKHKSEDPVNHGSEFFFTILFEKFAEDNTLKSPIKSDDKAIPLESNLNTSIAKNMIQDKDLKAEVSGLNKSSWKFLIVDGIVLFTSTLFILFLILIPTYI